MPPITVAFVMSEDDFPQSIEDCKHYVETNIENAFVLDGIQRLNTLGRLQDSPILDKDKKVYIIKQYLYFVKNKKAHNINYMPFKY